MICANKSTENYEKNDHLRWFVPRASTRRRWHFVTLPTWWQRLPMPSNCDICRPFPKSRAKTRRRSFCHCPLSSSSECCQPMPSDVFASFDHNLSLRPLGLITVNSGPHVFFSADGIFFVSGRRNFLCPADGICCRRAHSLLVYDIVLSDQATYALLLFSLAASNGND